MSGIEDIVNEYLASNGYRAVPALPNPLSNFDDAGHFQTPVKATRPHYDAPQTLGKDVATAVKSAALSAADPMGLTSSALGLGDHLLFDRTRRDLEGTTGGPTRANAETRPNIRESMRAAEAENPYAGIAGSMAGGTAVAKGVLTAAKGAARGLPALMGLGAAPDVVDATTGAGKVDDHTLAKALFSGAMGAPGRVSAAGMMVGGAAAGNGTLSKAAAALLSSLIPGAQAAGLPEAEKSQLADLEARATKGNLNGTERANLKRLRDLRDTTALGDVEADRASKLEAERARIAADAAETALRLRTTEAAAKDAADKKKMDDARFIAENRFGVVAGQKAVDDRGLAQTAFGDTWVGRNVPALASTLVLPALTGYAMGRSGGVAKRIENKGWESALKDATRSSDPEARLEGSQLAAQLLKSYRDTPTTAQAAKGYAAPMALGAIEGAGMSGLEHSWDATLSGGNPAVTALRVTIAQMSPDNPQRAVLEDQLRSTIEKSPDHPARTRAREEDLSQVAGQAATRGAIGGVMGALGKTAGAVMATPNPATARLLASRTEALPQIDMTAENMRREILHRAAVAKDTEVGLVHIKGGDYTPNIPAKPVFSQLADTGLPTGQVGSTPQQRLIPQAERVDTGLTSLPAGTAAPAGTAGSTAGQGRLPAGGSGQSGSHVISGAGVAQSGTFPPSLQHELSLSPSAEAVVREFMDALRHKPVPPPVVPPVVPPVPPAPGGQAPFKREDVYNKPVNGQGGDMASAADASRKVYVDAIEAAGGKPTIGNKGTLKKGEFPTQADAELQALTGAKDAKGLSAEQLHKRRSITEAAIDSIAKKNGVSYREAADEYFKLNPTTDSSGHRKVLQGLGLLPVAGAGLAGAMTDDELRAMIGGR